MQEPPNPIILRKIVTDRIIETGLIDMWNWTQASSIQYQGLSDKNLRYERSCQTAHCIAGWTIVEAYRIPFHQWNRESDELPDDEAQRLLDLPNKALFHMNRWPFDLRSEYECAESPAERALVTLKAIKSYMDNNGWDSVDDDYDDILDDEDEE